MKHSELSYIKLGERLKSTIWQIYCGGCNCNTQTVTDQWRRIWRQTVRKIVKMQLQWRKYTD